MNPATPSRRTRYPLASRYVLYFLLAALPAFIGVEKPPANGWEWGKFWAMICYQGLLAVKAVQSQPEGEKKPLQKPGE